MVQLAEEEGLSLDVVSGGELYTAIAADFPMERVHFHGNNKSREELEMALEHKIGYIVVDNFYELELLENYVLKNNKKYLLLLRVTPGIEAHTHDYILTGQEDSKFGFGITKWTSRRSTSKSDPFYMVDSLLDFIVILVHKFLKQQALFLLYKRYFKL